MLDADYRSYMHEHANPYHISRKNNPIKDLLTACPNAESHGTHYSIVVVFALGVSTPSETEACIAWIFRTVSPQDGSLRASKGGD
jgi:hypothetical protein